MRRISRRGMLLGLGLAATGLGCGGMNPFLIPYMFSGGESKTPAEYPLKPHAKSTEPKVVVLVAAKSGLPTDLTGVDRMINTEIVQHLDAAFKRDEEKVQVLKVQALDKFKNENPNWRSLNPIDIGKRFEADYLIDVEIVEMDLYKPGSRGQWLQGRATVSVAAFDLTKPLREPAAKWELPIQYPQNGWEQEVESQAQVSTVRIKFVQRIAAIVAEKFSATPSTSQRRVD